MLSHLDKSDHPRMVDVSEKAVTTRSAHARAKVILPIELAQQFENGELRTRKGPVFETAIIAGVMAAKRTHELIPFCHTIGLEDCGIEIGLNPGGEVVVNCRTRATHRTGVEMEALTGATVAALTIYDMCKSASHGIVIQDVHLVEKHGGKRDYRTPDAETNE